jgi:hypothetical protein
MQGVYNLKWEGNCSAKKFLYNIYEITIIFPALLTFH